MRLSSTLLLYITDDVVINRLSPTIDSSADIVSDMSRELLMLLSSISLIELDKVDLENRERVSDKNGSQLFCNL